MCVCAGMWTNVFVCHHLEPRGGQPGARGPQVVRSALSSGPRASQSFLRKPNEDGCQLDWLEKGSGPPLAWHANKKVGLIYRLLDLFSLTITAGCHQPDALAPWMFEPQAVRSETCLFISLFG